MPLTRQSWNTLVCQRHLVSLIPVWLWRAEWDTWCDTPDAHRIAASEYGLEPTVDTVEGAQRVPKDRGNGVISAAPGNQHPCRCQRPKHVSVENAHSSMEQLLVKNPDETQVPVVKPRYMRSTGIIIVDTGASSDILGTDIATRLYSEYVRPTARTLEFATANQKQVYSANGVRMQIASWDVPTDVVLMKDAPQLMSLGGRCLHAGHSFLWVNQRLPVLFPHGGQYVVIFDLDGVVPIYRPELERNGGIHGTFELAMNAFRDRCGFSINEAGFIQLDLPPLSGWQRTRPRRKHSRSPGMSTAATTFSTSTIATQTDDLEANKNRCDHAIRGAHAVGEDSVVNDTVPHSCTHVHVDDDETGDPGGGSSDDAPPPPVPYGPEPLLDMPPTLTTAERDARNKLFAKSKKHLLTHTPACNDCDGCLG